MIGSINYETERGRMSDKEMVTISKSEYDTLLKEVRWLQCLEAAGVDNWSGFEDAAEIYREWDAESE